MSSQNSGLRRSLILLIPASDDRCLGTQCAMDNSHIDVDAEAYVWFGGVVVRSRTSDS